MQKIPESYRKHLRKYFTEEVLDYPRIVTLSFIARPFAAKKFIFLEYDLDELNEQRLKGLAHELVHVKQQIGKVYLFWLLAYGMKFLKNYFLNAIFGKGFNRIKAYKQIPEEVEAYALETQVMLE